MILILAHHYDSEAKWLTDNLANGLKNSNVKLLIAEALGIDYLISLSLNDNCTKTVIRFKNADKALHAEDILLVINRLVFIDPIVWNHSAESEKSYATNEMNAFFSAFIYSFTCPVINQVIYGSLAGNNSDILSMVNILRNNHITINKIVHDECISAQMAEDNLAECLRLMLWDRKIFFPDIQLNENFSEKIKSVFNKITYASTLELFFRPNTSGFELIHISRMPALSIYGQSFLNYLTDKVNTALLCS